MHFVSACIYIFGMEIIILMDEMLLTHEVENILGTIKIATRKLQSR
jgi:hypothetical protein